MFLITSHSIQVLVEKRVPDVHTITNILYDKERISFTATFNKMRPAKKRKVAGWSNILDNEIPVPDGTPSLASGHTVLPVAKRRDKLTCSIAALYAAGIWSTLENGR